MMSVMNDNIEKVVDRGERLESLLDKTNELEVSVSILLFNNDLLYNSIFVIYMYYVILNVFSCKLSVHR